MFVYFKFGRYSCGLFNVFYAKKTSYVKNKIIQLIMKNDKINGDKTRKF